MLVQSLESRVLRSATLNSANHVLTVLGTPQNDVISIKVSGTMLLVTQNGVSQSFNKTAVRSIAANGGKGGDTISLDANVFIPATLDAGPYSSVEGALDRLIGGSGNDKFHTQDNQFVDVYGGAGNDTIWLEGKYGAGYGGSGDDTIYAENERCDGIGEAGNDLIKASGESADADGGPGNDTLWATNIYTTAEGDSGNDTLYGIGEFCELDGGSGNDTLKIQELYSAHGGDGDDRFVLLEAIHYFTFDGDAGIDTVDCTAFSSNLILGNRTALANRGVSDGASGLGEGFGTSWYFGDDVEVFIGGRGNDYIVGGAIGNRLEGRGGNDTLVGGGGKDALFGGDGDDRLLSRGDGAADFLSGGYGNDTADADTFDQLIL